MKHRFSRSLWIQLHDLLCVSLKKTPGYEFLVKEGLVFRELSLDEMQKMPLRSLKRRIERIDYILSCFTNLER